MDRKPASWYSGTAMALVLAVIGGSGIQAIPGLGRVELLTIDTPYGAPSSNISRGRFGDVEVLFLSRHGEHHQIAPHAVNYRANVCAVKMAGATHLLSLSAVGSMRDSIRPTDVVVVSDFIDLTRTRINTFFDGGPVAHVAMAPPICPDLSAAASRAAKVAGATVHPRGTYLCIEGPQFSTRAESHLYRTWNVDVIGMTAMPEAKLAREAELPYATVAFVTDYDSWNDAEAAVSVAVVASTLKKNAEVASRLVRELVADIPDPTASPAFGALRNSAITDPSWQDAESSKRLAWLLGASHKQGQMP